MFGGDAGTAGMCFWTCPQRENELHRLVMSERERGGAGSLFLPRYGRHEESVSRRRDDPAGLDPFH